MGIQKVDIERVYPVDDLDKDKKRDFVDLTMTTRPRDLFHDQLREMGYYATEGERGAINEFGEDGIIFSIYKLDGDKRTKDKAGIITTRLWESDDN